MFSQYICSVQLNTAWKSDLSDNDSDNLLRFTKMVKCLNTVFLKNKTLFLILDDQKVQTMQL